MPFDYYDRDTDVHTAREPGFTPTTTQQMSAEASRAKMPTRVEQIIASLKTNGPQSRNLLAASSPMRLSTVCAAVNRLVAEGVLIISGTLYDEKTHRTVEIVSLAPEKAAA